MTNPSRLLFLFGSGISVPAKFPNAAELTERVLSGEGVIRHTDGIYYLNKDSSGYPLTDEFVPRVKSFLKVAKKEIDAYYKKLRDTNFSTVQM